MAAAEPIDDSVHMAARNNEIDTVRAALAASNNTVANAQDKIKRTPLHLAAWAGHLPVVELLLEKGSEPNADALDNMVPLAFAAQNGHSAVCTALLAAKADPNHANSKTGKTPLMTATSKGKLAVIKLLIDGGADIKQKTHGGKTAAGFVNAASAGAETAAEMTKLLAHDEAAAATGDGPGGEGDGAQTKKKKKKKNRQKKVTKRDREPPPPQDVAGGAAQQAESAGGGGGAEAAAAAAGPAAAGSIGPRMPPPKRTKPPSVALSFADELE
jgi:hypothetical protein